MSRKKRSAKTLKQAHKPGRKQGGGAVVSAQLQQIPVLQQQGKLAEALQLAQGILAHQPHNPDALYYAGTLAYRLGHVDQAIATMETAVAANPKDFESFSALGVMLKAAGKPDEAEAAFGRSLKINPGFADAHNNLGNLLQSLEKHEEAIESYDRAARLKPDYMDVHYNLGISLHALGRMDDALQSYEKALSLHPGLAEAHNNRGRVLEALGRFDEAEAADRQAMALSPDYADAHSNLGMVLLLTGRFAEGWAEHEWRWKAEKLGLKKRPFMQAPWDGSPLSGKTILVWGEQGIGDELRYAGFIPDLTQQGATVVVECDPLLAPLFARSFVGVESIPRVNPPHPRLFSDDIDFQSSMGGLARYLRPDMESFPRHEGYLKADAEQVTELRKRYGGGGEKLLVGISWYSSVTILDIKWPALAAWSPLLSVPGGITFVDLQYGNRESDRAAFLGNTGVDMIHDGSIDPLKDMDGFAAQVAAMDLVVSIGNSTVETAGALGVPTWSLIQRHYNWVWLLEREHSPWYPSLRLYRQSERGEWESVIEEVAQALQRKAAER